MDKSKEIEPSISRRKRLLFRSWHRGTKEADLLIGSFVEKYVYEFSDAELDQLEMILGEADPDIYNWVIGAEKPPANLDGNVMQKLLAHRYK